MKRIHSALVLSLLLSCSSLSFQSLNAGRHGLAMLPFRLVEVAATQAVYAAKAPLWEGTIRRDGLYAAVKQIKDQGYSTSYDSFIRYLMGYSATVTTANCPACKKQVLARQEKFKKLGARSVVQGIQAFGAVESDGLVHDAVAFFDKHMNVLTGNTADDLEEVRPCCCASLLNAKTLFAGALLSPVQQAVLSGDVPILELFIDTSACDLDVTTDAGQTLLHLAAMYPDGVIAEQMIFRLMQAGADATLVDQNSRSPLHFAAACGNCAAARRLLVGSDTGNRFKNWSREKLGCLACWRPRLKSYVDAADYQGETAYSLATCYEMRALLERYGAATD